MGLRATAALWLEYFFAGRLADRSGSKTSPCGPQMLWPRGYKTFFMLISAEHEISSANKYENANNSWHFHIY